MSSSCCSRLSSERHFSPLHPLGFPFHLTHPQSVHPRSITLSLRFCSRKPSQQGRGPPACPLSGEIHWRHGVLVLSACLLHPAVPGWGQGIWAKRCQGASYSLLPFLRAWILQQSWEISSFLQQWGSSAPRCFPSTRGESGNLLALLRNARAQCCGLGRRCAGAAGCCREERLRGRQAQSQNSSEMGREMRWLTWGKVNDFRTGRGGAISHLQSASTWAVLSVITAVLAGPAGKERGSAGWAVCLR